MVVREAVTGILVTLSIIGILLIGYGIFFGIGCLGYWLLCLGFGWEFNIFIPLGIGVFGIFIAMIFNRGDKS